MGLPLKGFTTLLLSRSIMIVAAGGLPWKPKNKNPRAQKGPTNHPKTFIQKHQTRTTLCHLITLLNYLLLDN